MLKFFLETPKKGRSKILAKIWPTLSEVLDPLVDWNATQSGTGTEALRQVVLFPLKRGGINARRSPPQSLQDYPSLPVTPLFRLLSPICCYLSVTHPISMLSFLAL